MKILLWIVWLSVLSVDAHADDKTYNWVLEQYEAKNGSEIEYSSSGQIDGKQHLAIISGHNDPILTVFKRGPTQYIGIAQTVSLPFGATVEIRKNSIFLETRNCHHGCNTERLQFKYVGQLFRLVGVESQGETNSCYYRDRIAYEHALPDCEKHELMYGNSYNLLTSTTICWLTDVDVDAHTKLASHEVPKSYIPRGVQHKMALRQIDLPLLDGIFIYKLALPKSCYFDYNRKLLKE